MIGLLGKKIGMTQIFDEEGRKVPVTVLSVGPCHVTNLSLKETVGYNAVQLGFDVAKESRLNKPSLGHFKRANAPALKFVREIRTDEVEGLMVGQQLSVDNFQEGDFVDIEGVSKGHGFQGVVKRHGMKGAQTKSHGSKMGREVGSVGASATPSRVIKGIKLPGQMGNKVTTTQNIKVVKIDIENNLMAVKGAVPGANSSYLVIRAALKKSAPRKWKIQSSETAESSVNEDSVEPQANRSSSKKAAEAE